METIVFRIKFIKVYIIHCLLPTGSALRKKIVIPVAPIVLRNLLCNHSLSNSFPSFRSFLRLVLAYLGVCVDAWGEVFLCLAVGHVEG